MRSWCCVLLGVLVATTAYPAEDPGEAAISRLAQRLREVPRRWATLGPPQVPVSGKTAEEVLQAASAAERKAAREGFLALLRLPADQRAEVMAQRARSESSSELDLWSPGSAVEEQTRGDAGLAAAMTCAWLDLAEAHRRRDVLMRAASAGLQLLRLHRPAEEAAVVAGLWVALPAGPPERRQAALLADEYGDALQRLGQYEEALREHRRARALFQQAGFLLGEANTWDGEADVLVRLERFAEARTAYQQARARYQQAHSPLGEANTWQSEGELLYLMRRNQEALSAQRTARALFQQVGSKRGQGNTWRGEAEVLFMLARYDEALQAQQTARGLFHEAGDKVGEASTRQGEGEALYRLGRLEEALAADQAARMLYQAMGARRGIATAWHNEGLVLAKLGRIDEALKAQRAARALYADLGSRLGQANTWDAEADVLYYLGRADDALAAYRTARPLFEAASALIGQANTWHGEGKVLVQMGQEQQALAANRQARQLFHQAGDMLGEANTWVEEADLLSLAGSNAKALAAAEKARPLYQQAGATLGLANAWDCAGYILKALGRIGEAKEAAAQAIRGMQQVHATAGELGPRLLLIRCHLLLHEQEAAVKQAEAVLPLLRVLRSRGITDEDRTSLIEWSLPYEILVPHYARQPGQILAALRLAEAAHAPVLLDLVHQQARHSGTAAPQQDAAVQADLAAVDKELAATLDAAARRSLQQRRRTLEAQRGRLQFWAGVEAPIGMSAPIDDEQRRSLIDQSGPALLYFTTPTELVAFLLVPGTAPPRVHIRAVSPGALREVATDLRGRLANPRLEIQEDTPLKLRAAYDLLLGPFAQELLLYRGKPLIVVPHGPLHQLPFGALLDPQDTPLGQAWSLSVVPSLSVLAELRGRPRGTAPVPFALLSAGTGLDLSPAAARQLTALYGTQAVARLGARYADYLETARQARHLLLTTHGYHVPDSRDETFLELSPSSDGSHDSRLRASEIAAIPLAAEVVVLAACETARGEALLSDERLDLTRAFLTAGARAVIATRWKVPAGEATQQFLLDLHRLLAQGQGGRWLRADEALGRAQQFARERGAPAAVWAAFVLVGDPGQPVGPREHGEDR